jgi:thiamine-monophosphate kinase
MPSEFQIIDRFLAPFPRAGKGVVLGPGDDCAILRATPGTELCITTDALVENVHFDPKRFSDADIGHKALAVNLSDIAAMGAVPRWFVCSVACRPSDIPRIPRIARGMAALAARCSIPLVGGNFTSADALSLHITAAGEVPCGQALTRSGARRGDLIYVTGTLGDAALVLAMKSIGRAVRKRQMRPTPRLEVGLIARRFAHAAIDVSDGLLQDLAHVLEASHVGARIDANQVPLSQTFRDVCANLDLALNGGEDYELVIIVPPGRARSFEQICASARQKVTRIGSVVAGRELNIENAPHLKQWGFDHFVSGRKPA